MTIRSTIPGALYALLTLSLLPSCADEAEPGSATTLRALGPGEGIVVDGRIVDGGGVEGSCLLYVALADYSYLALAVERNFDDGPPYCGAVEPYLARRDVIVAWDPADLVPVADQSWLQTLADEIDRPLHREVDYVWLNGPLQAELWGTVYGPIEQKPVPGLGDTCAVYLETDEGTPYALLDTEDAFGACPTLDAIPADATIRVPLDDLIEVDDPAEVQALDQTFFGASVDAYFFLDSTPTQL